MLSKLRAYAELMRLANVFTAISNVWMGMIVATASLPGWTAVGVSASSALLYLAGMVLNDVFDHQIDAMERPERPIPSGRVPLGTARTLGWVLLGGGTAAGWATAIGSSTYAPGLMATALAVAIVAYDGGLKSSQFGPICMSLCRALNVLLGFSIAATVTTAPGFNIDVGNGGIIPAMGIGLYVFGVTWFARSEASESSRPVLTMSMLGATAGLALLAAMPLLTSSPPLQIGSTGWFILWIVVGGSILRRMVVAVMQPSPRFVQRAVAHAILSIIVIDASICLGFASPFWALAVLALLAPAMLLAQFLKVT